MRHVIFALCICLLVAALFGLAHPRAAPGGVPATAAVAAPVTKPAQCADRADHGQCLVVVANAATAPPDRRDNLTTRFVATPVHGTGRNLAPSLPPPRQFS